jgi:hypothetical protein
LDSWYHYEDIAKQAGGLAQVEKLLPRKWRPLSSNSSKKENAWRNKER